MVLWRYFLSPLPFQANQIKPLTVIPVLFIYHLPRPPTSRCPPRIHLLWGRGLYSPPSTQKQLWNGIMSLYVAAWQGKPVIRGVGIRPPAGLLWKCHSNKRTGASYLICHCCWLDHEALCSGGWSWWYLQRNNINWRRVWMKIWFPNINWRVSVVVPRCFLYFI